MKMDQVLLFHWHTTQFRGAGAPGYVWDSRAFSLTRAVDSQCSACQGVPVKF